MHTYVREMRLRSGGDGGVAYIAGYIYIYICLWVGDIVDRFSKPTDRVTRTRLIKICCVGALNL